MAGKGYGDGRRSQTEITEKDNRKHIKELRDSTLRRERMMTSDNIAKMGVQAVAEVYGTGREALNVINNAVVAEAGKINDSLQGIRETFGGMGRDIDFEYMADSASSNAMRRYMIMSDAYSEQSEKAIMGSVKTGEQVLANISDRGNIIESLLGDPAIAFKNQEAILNDLSTKFGDEINKLSEESVVKLAFYEDSLGASASTLQSIFQKQIGFTGEISTDALDKLGAYAANLSNELNIPMKALTKMTTEMMSNTQMFGDITVEEATRMSAKLSQLGVSMDQLNQQSAKFGSFQGAASAAGTIAQLTGAQVDAMKMSFLTSEGRFDELIEYQRESLLKAGFTKEKFLSQSNAMRNAIADSFGRSQEEMAVLLDRNRRITSQEEMDAIMKQGEVAEEDGFDALLNNIDQTKLALEDVDKLIARTNEKARMRATEGAVKAMEQQAKLNASQLKALEVVASDINVDRIESSLKAVGDLYSAIDPKRFIGTAEEMLKTLTAKSNEPGGFFNTMDEKFAKFQSMNNDDNTEPSDPQSEETGSAAMRRGLNVPGVADSPPPPVNVESPVNIGSIVFNEDTSQAKVTLIDEAGNIKQEIMADVEKKFVKKSQ